MKIDFDTSENSNNSLQDEIKNGLLSKLYNCFLGPYQKSDSKEIDSKDSSYKIITYCFIWCNFIFVIIFNLIFGYKAIDLVIIQSDEYTLKTTLFNTPLVFIALLFISSLFFLDSIIKTLKYQSRPQESIIVLILKNIGIIFLLYYLAKN